MNGGPYRYCGRDFSQADRAARRSLHRKELSREVCRRLDWRNGGLKGARVAMLRMHGPPAAAVARADCPPVPGPATERPLLPERLAQPVAVEPVQSADEGRLWNEFVDLGYSTLPGARYFVRADGGEPLAILGFGAAAWKPRDNFVGRRDPPPHR